MTKDHQESPRILVCEETPQSPTANNNGNNNIFFWLEFILDNLK